MAVPRVETVTLPNLSVNPSPAGSLPEVVNVFLFRAPPLTGARQSDYVMFTKQAAIAFFAANQKARSLESTSWATNLTTRALKPCRPTPSDS